LINVKYIFFIAILISTTASAQQVRFRLFAPGLSDTSNVYITGSHTSLGNWDPGIKNLRYNGNNLWEINISLSGPITLEYKYTLGSWSREAQSAGGSTLPNKVLDVKGDTLVIDTVYLWKASVDAGKTITSSLKGNFRYHRAMQPEGLKERDVIVWLPPGYDSTDKRYPVIYLQDGQNLFDVSTSAFGNEWRVDETADSMVRAGTIPPVIIVGINNTSDRSDEYLPWKKNAAYKNFLVHKLKPFIDSAYRTKKDAANTIVGGSSAGGIFAFMIVWEYPRVFSKAICMSPAFVSPDGFKDKFDYVINVREAEQRPKKVFFYIDNGGRDLDKLLQPGVDQMISALAQKRYRGGKDYVFIRDEAATHNEAAWANRLPYALKRLFANY
jgi:predicted alpha/beta superfamily hydrolase